MGWQPVGTSTPAWVKKSVRSARSQWFHVDTQMVQTLLGLALVFMAGYTLFSGREPEAVVLSADEQWRLENVEPVDWSKADVFKWAGSLGMPDVARNLRKHGVDGQLLIALTEEDVTRDLLPRQGGIRVKKLILALARLKGNAHLPPSANAQLLLKAAELAGNSTGPLSNELSLLQGVGGGGSEGGGTVEVYRIWEEMAKTSSVQIGLSGDVATMPHILAAITKKVHDLGGDDFVEGSSATKIVTRAGLNIMKISDMPPKVFVLMGQEAYLYPTENIGEVFKVPLAESSRSITVEVLSHSPQLLIVRNFLAPSECEDVIKAATPKMEPSTVLKQGDQTSGENKVRDSVRTSSTAWMMDRNVPIVKALRERTEELMGAQNDWTEDLQVLRYEPKQHYHVHTDYFDPKLYANDKRWAAGHNRLATVFFYLTTVEEGGQTVFPYGNTRKEDFARVHAYGRCEDALPTALKVPAVQGNAIIFYSLKAKGHLRGELDPTSLHGGCDPIKGTKWAANLWIRNGPKL